MAKGGARKGAGRKKGSAILKKTQLLAKEVSEQGVTPLEVLLTTMREVYAESLEPIPENCSEEDRRLAERARWGMKSTACALAKDAAPYVHPKLAASQMELSGEVSTPVINVKLHDGTDA